MKRKHLSLPLMIMLLVLTVAIFAQPEQTSAQDEPQLACRLLDEQGISQLQPSPTDEVSIAVVPMTATAIAQTYTTTSIPSPQPQATQVAQNAPTGVVGQSGGSTLPNTGGGGNTNSGLRTTAAYEETEALADANLPPTEYDGVDNDDIITEDYGENPIEMTAEDNLSTFAMDVDTASFTLARSYLLDYYELPPAGAIRPEEFINYFPSNYTPPQDGSAFAIHLDAAPSPFAANGEVLMRVGIQGRTILPEDRDPALLIFVVDTSGSMSGSDRIGLVKESLGLLVSQLRPDDCVGIVEYANGANVVLVPTPASQQATIINAVNRLEAGGSTYAEEGLRVGYNLALQTMVSDATTRVILLSDGVANVGATGPDAILQTIRNGVEEGITMTSVGIGMGNYNDVLLEQLANDGNGSYFYVDSIREARRVFIHNLTSTLQVIGYDAKIQVEFNADVVTNYRLIGYENRAIADSDFRNDTVDVGEVGAGHSVTALYELTLADNVQSGELARAYIRYQDADTRDVVEVNNALEFGAVTTFDSSAPSFQLLAGVAEFAELLRNSSYAETGSFEAVLAVVQPLQQLDPSVDDLINMVNAAIRSE